MGYDVLPNGHWCRTLSDGPVKKLTERPHQRQPTPGLWGLVDGISAAMPCHLSSGVAGPWGATQSQPHLKDVLPTVHSGPTVPAEVDSIRHRAEECHLFRLLTRKAVVFWYSDGVAYGTCSPIWTLGLVFLISRLRT